MDLGQRLWLISTMPRRRSLGKNTQGGALKIEREWSKREPLPDTP